MRKNELIYYYALDRKWMSTDQANLLLKRGEEEGLLKQANGTYTPSFDIQQVTIPLGFKPTSAVFDAKDPAQDLIARIASARKMDEPQVVAEVNALIRDRFDGNLLPAAALVIIAKQHNVPFDDLLQGLMHSLEKK
jgi:hypothetical protein